MAEILGMLLGVLAFGLVVACVVAFVFFKRWRFKLLCFAVWFFMWFTYTLLDVISINTTKFDDVLDEIRYRELKYEMLEDMTAAYFLTSLVVLLISIAIKACINKYKEYRDKK